MKKVFDNHMVAHVWAQQTQSEGRSGNGNFWFRDSVIYSYQTPIANIVLAANGTRAALITSNKYSSTTGGKHLTAIHRAIGYGDNSIMPDFYVPHLGVSGGWNRDWNMNLEKAYVANMASFQEAYEAAKLGLKRKRELWRTPAEELEVHYNAAMDYARTFNMPAPVMSWVTDAAEIVAFRAARDARNNTPAKVAAKERARERERAKVREAYRAGDPISGTYRARERLDAMMTNEDKTIRGAVLRARMAGDIAAWFAGEKDYLRFDAETGGAALRVKGDMLETSHGAEVPLAHAIRAFRFLKLCKERGQGWDANGHSLRVGQFTIEHVEPDGSFKAGCHRINWPEIERIARQLGILEAAPSDEALALSHNAA